MKTQNIQFAGLGGMGVIKASDVMADVVFHQGFDVKKAEVHGMSQRGGSISSDVRYGENVQSPMIPAGECDILVVLEETQIEIVRSCLKPDGILIVPKDIDVSRLPSAKALNVAMLGKLSKLLPFTVEAWQEALHAHFAQKLWAGNDAAFLLGRE